MRACRPVAQGYALAIAAIGLAVLLRMATHPLLGDRTPYLFLVPAVLAAALHAGRGPALAAVAVGAALTHLIELPLEPAIGPGFAGWARVLVFVAICLTLIELAMSLRRAELRGARAIERLDLALTTGNMGVWEWDLQTHEVWWSDSLEPVHGLPRGAFGRTFDAFRQLIHEGDRDRVSAALEHAIATQSAFQVEFRFIRPNGAVRWMNASGRVFTDEHGKPLRVVGTSRDVTEHHEATGALREIEGRFEAVMTHAPLVVFAKDRHGRYLMVNGMFAQLLARTEDEILGRTDAELFPPEIAALASERDADVIATGEPVELEQRYRTRDRTYAFLTIKFALRDRDGNPVAVCAIANDITARQEAEAALKDADRRKDEFLAILAHELRNPLAPVRLALEMLRTSDGDRITSERAMDVMGRQLAHLVRLIDDLLDVSRITRGKLELRRGSVYLGDVIRTALETSRPQIDAAGHTLVVTIPDQPIELHADLTRLAQVISNLLNNAAKYTPRGGRIELDAEATDAGVEISVSDSGIGIAPEHVGRVFEMFAQVGPITTRGHGGLGIGLALARALVEMHGGTIEVTSAGTGHGSTFAVFLPRVAPPEAIARTPDPEVRVVHGLRVLVADDNRDATETLALFLERSGHTVFTANDGEEASAAAAAFHPDVCVLDIGMPRMDGYEVARRLREADAAVPHAPDYLAPVLIALTGWGQAEDHRRSREAGFDYHLIKPVQPGTLVKLLATASRPA